MVNIPGHYGACAAVFNNSKVNNTMGCGFRVSLAESKLKTGKFPSQMYQSWAEEGLIILCMRRQIKSYEQKMDH